MLKEVVPTKKSVVHPVVVTVEDTRDPTNTILEEKDR
jgi:hypothetical protein